MLRIQAQLTEEQARRLKTLAADEGVSVAALLRRGADLVLDQGAGETREDRRRRALEAVGRFTDAADVARRHIARERVRRHVCALRAAQPHNYVVVETVALTQRRLGLQAVTVLRDAILAVVQETWIDRTCTARLSQRRSRLADAR